MIMFIAGLIIFFGAHFFSAFCRAERGKVINVLGPVKYKGLYSLVSLVGFVLIIIGWRHADATPLYGPLFHSQYLVMALMPFALILLAAAYLPAGRIAHIVKHPMLAGVKIWALAHLLANGEVRSVLLFGLFLVFAIADRIAVKQRQVPIRSAGPWRNDGLALAVGVGAYVLLLHMHQHFTGVRLI